MTNSYETVDFLKEQKVKLGSATYIVIAHFLDQGETFKVKIQKLLKLEVKNYRK